MDTVMIRNLISASLIFISVMTLLTIILIRYGNKIFDKEYKPSNVLLIVTASLFIIILIVHLVSEQIWAVDILKILVGVLIGTSSTKLSKKKSKMGSTIDNSGINHGEIAGRDINKNIQNIEKAISEIRDSVIHQNVNSEQISDGDLEKDYLINTIYERAHERQYSGIAKALRHWSNEGWTLKHFSSDYNGMDGLFLIFERPKESNDMQVYYYHGSNFEKIEEYHTNLR